MFISSYYVPPSSEATDAIVIGFGDYIITTEGTSEDRLNLLSMVREKFDIITVTLLRWKERERLFSLL